MWWILCFIFKICNNWTLDKSSYFFRRRINGLRIDSQLFICFFKRAYIPHNIFILKELTWKFMVVKVIMNWTKIFLNPSLDVLCFWPFISWFLIISIWNNNSYNLIFVLIIKCSSSQTLNFLLKCVHFFKLLQFLFKF